MNQEQWTVVDKYITDLFVPPDPVLDATIQSTTDANMPLINVAPNQGKLLHVLALMKGAHKILEIGTQSQVIAQFGWHARYLLMVS